jgi:hypothetical protein
MLQIIVRMDKMAALYQMFLERGMMYGTISSYMVGITRAKSNNAEAYEVDSKEDEEDDEGPELGNQTQDTLSDVKLAAKTDMCNYNIPVNIILITVFRTGLSRRFGRDR